VYLAIGTPKLANVDFDGVLVVKGLDKNLISVGKTFNGQCEFSTKLATLHDGSKAHMTAQLVNGLYTIKASDLQAAAMLAYADSKAIDLLQDWHQRLGHLNVRSVMDMSRDGRIDGLSQVSAKDVDGFRCEACIKRKRNVCQHLQTISDKLIHWQLLTSVFGVEELLINWRGEIFPYMI
jgi:hypothetical protein